MIREEKIQMDVQSTAGSLQAWTLARQLQSARQVGKADLKTPQEKPAPPDDQDLGTPTIDKPGNGPKSGRAHGVLRLLEAGHFHPVADQRLRANFADLLTDSAADPNPGSGSDNLEPVDSVDVAPIGSGETFDADAEPASPNGLERMSGQ
jgi:hypothetical protein